jgi:APA family basic amino acid/polyamine antiporter
MATTAAGETKNPKRNIPMGMLIGLVAVILLYVAATYFLCAAVPYEQLGEGGKGTAAPMAKALELLGYHSATLWVTVGSTVALISVLLASAYSTTRLLFNMAQYKMLPGIFGKVNAKQVPVVSTLVVGGSIGILTALLDVDQLMHLTNIGTMTCFITASLIVLWKAVKQTDWKNRRQVINACWWILVGVLGVLGPARLMAELPISAFIRLGVVWGAVILLFVFYTRHHSLARTQKVVDHAESFHS